MTPSANVVVACLLSLSLTQMFGCGPGIRHVNLAYPPEQGDTEIPPSAVIENAGSLIRSDVILEVFDARPEKDRLGALLNDFGGVVADFVTGDNVTVWIENAIAYELTEARYTVLQESKESTPDAAIGLTVDI